MQTKIFNHNTLLQIWFCPLLPSALGMFSVTRLVLGEEEFE